LILNTFGSWKRVFPRVMPFTWDQRLAELDRLVHFGTDPWKLLHPMLGSGWITLLLDDLYFTWAPVVFTAMVSLIWFGPRSLRRRGLLGIAFVWIALGTIGATALSSAGPCFYGHVVAGHDPFRPLLEYLASVAEQYPLYTTAMQEVAWQLHRQGQADIDSGISAMPSVHVAMGALLALIGWEWNRWLGIGFWLYTAVTLVATIHLGWHYAIDGYLSIIVVSAFWAMARRIERGRDYRVVAS
jgi:hypothetical protein